MPTRPMPLRTFTADRLEVRVYADRQALGKAAALDVAATLQRLLNEQAKIRLVFAAAPSQNEFLANLACMENLDWSRVEAFHMDEYIGLPPDAPQSFGHFLRERLFDVVHPGRVEYINGNAPDPLAEAKRYAALLKEQPIDLVCAGIGENGHLAFNDPHVADFEDPEMVKVVDLDEACRLQQVHDGAFAHIDDVPRLALTLTIPALEAARYVFCMVPGPTKATAVFHTLFDPITPACPATVLRRHPHAQLYLDTASAARI